MTTLRTVTCAECPRMIVRADGETGYPLCAACLSRPGWIKDPLMRWLFAPRSDDPPEPPPQPVAPRRRFGIVALLAVLIWTGVIGATLRQIFGG